MNLNKKCTTILLVPGTCGADQGSTPAAVLRDGDAEGAGAMGWTWFQQWIIGLMVPGYPSSPWCLLSNSSWWILWIHVNPYFSWSTEYEYEIIRIWLMNTKLSIHDCHAQYIPCVLLLFWAGRPCGRCPTVPAGRARAFEAGGWGQGRNRHRPGLVSRGVSRWGFQ